MNSAQDNFDDSVEAQLTRVQPHPKFERLREATLDKVHRELRSSRWDWRLARAAALLLTLGIGMNIVTISKRQLSPTDGPLMSRPTPESIAEFAARMADVTDIETAGVLARQVAAFSGFSVRGDEAKMIEREIERRLSPALHNKKEG